MTTNDIFTYDTPYNSYDCNLSIGEYDNGNLALSLIGAAGTEYEGELIAVASVNPGIEVPRDCLAVKNYSENSGMLDFLRGIGVVGETAHTINSGFVWITVCRLAPGGLELFSTKG